MKNFLLNIQTGLQYTAQNVAVNYSLIPTSTYSDVQFECTFDTEMAKDLTYHFKWYKDSSEILGKYDSYLDAKDVGTAGYTVWLLLLFLYKKYFFSHWYTIIKTDWIINMDHMRISGIKPSPVIKVN